MAGATVNNVKLHHLRISSRVGHSILKSPPSLRPGKPQMANMANMANMASALRFVCVIILRMLARPVDKQQRRQQRKSGVRFFK
jgi:hypothetical protein